MSSYFKILRPTNLLVIVITQVIVYYLVILPSLYTHHIDPVLSGGMIPFFIAVTLLLAATANIINDLKDQQIDQINKLHEPLVTKENRQSMYIMYGILLLLGALIAGYIAVTIDRKGLFFVYPVAALLLYGYSFWFKSIPLVGNVIVSLFCALVIAIIWYAEAHAINRLGSSSIHDYERLIYLLSGFTIFSFLSNFIRELIKDAEDAEGDRIGGIRTFAVAYGIERTKVMALFNLLILWIISGMWLVNGWQNYFSLTQIIASSLLILILPLYIFKMMRILKNKSHLSFISKLMKAYMGAGLVALLILSQ